jgi:hypothetical protein
VFGNTAHIALVNLNNLIGRNLKENKILLTELRINHPALVADLKEKVFNFHRNMEH